MKVAFRPHNVLSLLVLSFIFSIGGASVSAQTRPEQGQVNIEKKIIDGKKYQLLGDLEKAENIFKSILADDVNNTVAFYELWWVAPFVWVCGVGNSYEHEQIFKVGTSGRYKKWIFRSLKLIRR